MTNDIQRLFEEVMTLPADEQRQLYAMLDKALAVPASSNGSGEEEFRHRLVEAGLLSEIKPLRRDAESFHAWTPVTVQGKPVSETLIEERR